MGRPPLGKVAMTGAERVRRYRRQHGTAKPVTKQTPPVTKQAGPQAAATEPQITPDMLSMSAQEKLEAFKRQYKRQLGNEFAQRIHAEVRERVDVVLSHYREQLAEAEKVLKIWREHPQRLPFKRDEFRKLLACLHSDQGMSKKTMDDVFNMVKERERRLVAPPDEKPKDPLPSNWQEWEAMRQKATAVRKAKRAGSVARRG